MEMIAFYHQAESSIRFWFSCDLETLPFKLTETRILSLVNGRTDSFSLITNSSKLQRGKTNNLDKKKETGACKLFMVFFNCMGPDGILFVVYEKVTPGCKNIKNKERNKTRIFMVKLIQKV